MGRKRRRRKRRRTTETINTLQIQKTFQRNTSFYASDCSGARCIRFAITRCVHGLCIAALRVLIALILLGCVHVCLRFAVGVGLSGVCMFQDLLLMFVLVLNCEVL